MFYLTIVNKTRRQSLLVGMTVVQQSYLLNGNDIDTYEGCPSKSWTCAIKRDCLSGIL